MNSRHAPPDLPDRATDPDYPGFLRTARGQYITVRDFLAFIERAAEKDGTAGPDRARAWLQARGFPADIDRLTPRDVSLALLAAQKVIAPHIAAGQRNGRPHGP
jgi:hypothetical protein